MTPEHTKQLIEKYPEIFQQITNPPKQGPYNPITLFMFECGDGWYTLIDHLCGEIQHHLKYNAEKGTPQFVCDQVKEKFGTLRFYGHGGDKKIWAFIWFAESFSGKICETCGNPGKRRGIGWIYTACDQHTKPEDLEGHDEIGQAS